MMALPNGTVTFLFTDIEGSTAIAQAHPAAWETLRARHHALLQDAMTAHRGHVFQVIGDAFCVAFHTADDAVRAATAAQRALQAEAWMPAVVKVRVGLHTGEAKVGIDADQKGDYVGYQTLARVQGVMSVAHGEQVLLSSSVHELVRAALPADLVLLDLGPHRLKGFAEPETLWQLAAPGVRREFPALLSRAATPNNLPLGATRFIGRVRDIEECAHLLQGARLLTLTAIGGAGKTRLAIEVARTVLDDFPDGVWFVDLAPLQDGERIGMAIAGILGLRPQADTPVLDTVVRHLASRRVLIVLDNCEHVLDATAGVSEALAAGCANVVVLATSREGLGVAGEQIFTVRSLRMTAGSDLAAARESEAVALFMDRARLANASLQLDEASAPIVIDICRRLDGIALAIELAAARAKMLKLADIRTRLSDRFRLLTGGNRALPRQQTLLATLNWSYDQLTAAEQALLRRLGIFVGGWTLPAATAVADDGADEFEVLDTLTRLADKSLIAMDRDAAGESRYTMVETVRQYALDRLDEAHELPAVRIRHALYFVTLASESLAAQTDPMEIADWLARMEVEHENLLAAHAACGLHDDLVGPGLVLVRAVGVFWDVMGMYGLGHRLTTEALGRAGAAEPNAARAGALCRKAHLGVFLARYDESVRASEEALAIARVLDDKPLMAMALSSLGGLCNAQGDLRQARVYLEEAMVHYRAIGGMRLHRGRHMLGELMRREGDLAGAEGAYQENLDEARALRQPSRIAHCIVNIAFIATLRSDVPTLRRLLGESIQLRTRFSQVRRDVIVLELLAALASLEGAWRTAARFHGAATAVSDRIDFHLEPVDAVAVDPLIERARIAVGEDAFAALAAEGHALAMGDAFAEAAAWLAAET